MSSVNAKDSTWTVTVPNISNTYRTIGSNNWQYSLFPCGTAPSIMYPSDSLANMNDQWLKKFDYSTGYFLDTSSALLQNVMPMLKEWMAKQTELYQKTMMNISGNTNINIEKAEEGDASKVDGKKAIEETSMTTTIAKMLQDPKTAERMGKEIKFKDKNGKEQSLTLAQRIANLIKDYQQNPDDPESIEISKENYEIVWDILGKYAKTGKLSREDYATLIEIAKNPGGPGSHKVKTEKKEEKEKAEKEEKAKKVERPSKYQDALNLETVDNYKSLALEYKNDLYEDDATEESLALLTAKTNKYNVLPMVKEFNKNYGNLEDENIIDAIFADTSRWGKCDILMDALSDDAKPSVQYLSNALIDRAKDLLKNNPKLAEETQTDLKSKISALQSSTQNVETRIGKEPKKESKEAISKSFQNLLNKLDELETEIYGEYE